MDAEYRLRDGSEEDLPALAELDGSFSNEWVLYLERRGGTIEQTVELRWRKARPSGSRRNPQMDEPELRTELESSGRLVVAEAGGRAAGYVLLRPNWNRTAEVLWIVVDAAHRGRGLGRRFVEEAEAFGRERGLRAVQWEAQTDNRDALEFAVAHGFRLVAVHDAMYHNRGAESQLTAGFRGLAALLVKELD